MTHMSVKRMLLSMVGPVNQERFRATKQLGYVPHIKRPRTLNEKLLYQKLFNPPSNAHLITDKLRVRDHVAERVGPDILNDLYGVYHAFDEIDFASLPDEFVIKMNNSSKRNILVSNKAKANFDDIKSRLDEWLRTPYGIYTGELWHLRIEPRILIERFLRDEDGKIPWDYCFHTFHAKTRFIETQIERFGPRGVNATSSNWYDLDWNLQRIKQGTPNGPITPQPANLDAMVEIANRLAEGLGYARVDLYSIGGRRIVFGEITISPAAGRSRFEPVEVDFQLGSLW